jgi:phage shock protein A
MTGIIIDIVIVTLLVCAVGFGLVLERRVKRLMAALAELQPAVDQFAQAVDRTEGSVHALQAASANAAGAPRGTRAAQAPDPQAGKAASGGAVPNLRNLRNQAARSVRSAAPGTARVEGKSDLVRSFFEAAERRQA